MTIRLYDLAAADESIRFSPYCWRIRLALAHKGLAVETVPWRFTDKEAIAQSGQTKVPVIVDDGHCVHDSWDIALYLDSTYPDRPRLIEPAAMSQTLFIKHWTEASLHLALFRPIVAEIHSILHPKDQDYFRSTREKMLGSRLEQASTDAAAERARLQSVLEPLRRLLGQQDFIAGAAPAFCDYMPFGALQWARCVSTQSFLAADDAVAHWFERMLDLYDGLGRRAPRPAATSLANEGISA
jgi:glutathione S-transferase